MTDLWRTAAPLIEIAIISLIVYGLISFIRQTRGEGVARGLVLLVLIGFATILIIAQRARLENLLWILENLIGVSLIGAIVIFQPEIRRGLVRIGESARRLLGERGPSLADVVTDAAFAIAQRGETGALIVVERDTPVGAFMESGVILDAVLSAALLQTIFTKNSPLHDGAVILRRGRLAAAHCLLPLSENIEVCRGLGTRHRAAIGVTEESDAIVVVVSESTREVSLAMGGKLWRGLAQEQMRALLREHCDWRDTLQPAGEQP